MISRLTERFAGRRYAYVEIGAPCAVLPWGLGLAIEGEPRVLTVPGVGWAARTDAMSVVDRMNADVGLSRRQAARIVMRRLS